jgi:hypothetical protein
VGDIGPTVRAEDLGIVVEPEDPAALAGAFMRFLIEKDQIIQLVEPRALDYAKRNDWRVFGQKVRDGYVAFA